MGVEFDDVMLLMLLWLSVREGEEEEIDFGGKPQEQVRKGDKKNSFKNSLGLASISISFPECLATINPSPSFFFSFLFFLPLVDYFS